MCGTAIPLPCADTGIWNVKPPCPHRWLIQTPSGGPTSRGKCSLCREVREFQNWLHESNWNKTGLRRGAKKGTQASAKKAGAAQAESKEREKQAMAVDAEIW